MTDSSIKTIIVCGNITQEKESYDDLSTRWLSFKGFCKEHDIELKIIHDSENYYWCIPNAGEAILNFIKLNFKDAKKIKFIIK